MNSVSSLRGKEKEIICSSVHQRDYDYGNFAVDMCNRSFFSNIVWMINAQTNSSSQSDKFKAVGDFLNLKTSFAVQM